MESYHYLNQVANPDNFNGTAKVHCMQISFRSKDDDDPVTEKQVLDECDALKWVESTSKSVQGHMKPDAGHSLRIVAAENPDLAGISPSANNPLPLSQSTIQNILRAFSISPLFLTVALNKDSVFFTHHQRREVGTREDCLRFLFRTYHSRSLRLTLGLTYQPQAHQITALITDMKATDIEELWELLVLSKRQCLSPLLLPSIMAIFPQRYLKHRLRRCHEIVCDIRTQIGLPRNIIYNPTPGKGSIEDHLELSKTLTRVFEKLARCRIHLDGLLQYIELTDEGCRTCLAVAPEQYRAEASTAVEQTLAMNSHLVTTSKSLQAWTSYLDGKTQAYVQTVYSMISQRDNALSIQMAEASIRIAEATRADNLAMKMLAEDSKAAALIALQQNAAMRAIAIITMLFLPPTFIATLFSTTFFNFQSNDGPVVSRWIWIYVLLAVVTTAIIQSVWFWGARKQSVEIRSPSSGFHASIKDIKSRFESSSERK